MVTKRALTVVALVSAVIVVAAVVALVFSFGGDVTSYEQGSPEDVAQSYLTAALDGDFDRAAAFIDSSSDCSAEDLDRAYIDDAARISLIDSVIEGERARVRVNVEFPSGELIGGFFGEEHTLRLVRQGGDWLLTGVPWPLYDCASTEK